LAPGAVTAAIGLLVAGGGLVLVRRRRRARG
ncbi:LPXTG cell wall anchor domain-containing protein, partial [Clavibacter michiganensis subsp. insidiosus]